MNAAEIVGLLAEPDRLRVLSALVLGARTPSRVAAATGLGARDVGKALSKLQASGLVDAALEVRVDLVKQAAIAAAPPADTDPEAGEVVSRFVRDGRLLSLPAQESRRRQVLEYLVQTFEPGRRFPEQEVNVVLRAWTEGGEVDYATLRRYLVDHGFLDREDGLYWRSGGWVDTSGGIGTP